MYDKDSMKDKRCIALYSGGLDSILAIKLLEELGMEVIPVYFCTPFFGFEALRHPDSIISNHREMYGITVHIMDYTDEFMKIVREPAHGYGKHLNPCIDCKIGMLRIAKKLLEEMDASFVITGEVLGQRPMSQRSDTMRIIERESGLKGLLLRPLCARHMPETVPERLGIVKKEDMWGITGRGRKEQIRKAHHFGIRDENIPNAAGGCLLTDKRIARKVQKTFDRHSPSLPLKADVVMDVIGRKFMLTPQTILVLGRDESENEVLSTLVYPGNVFLRIQDVPGPLCILRGEDPDANLSLAAGICLRYSKAKGIPGQRAIYGSDPMHMDHSVTAPVVDEEYCSSLQD